MGGGGAPPAEMVLLLVRADRMVAMAAAISSGPLPAMGFVDCATGLLGEEKPLRTWLGRRPASVTSTLGRVRMSSRGCRGAGRRGRAAAGVRSFAAVGAGTTLLRLAETVARRGEDGAEEGSAGARVLVCAGARVLVCASELRRGEREREDDVERGSVAGEAVGVGRELVRWAAAGWVKLWRPAACAV